MEPSHPMLPADIEAVVAQHHGGPVPVTGQNGDHVVMSAAIFRDLMGVGCDEEFAASVAALQKSLAQVAAGQTISLEEAAHRLAAKYGG
jgi:hypothetical protein